jgi:hypothetical protein
VLFAFPAEVAHPLPDQERPNTQSRPPQSTAAQTRDTAPCACFHPPKGLNPDPTICRVFPLFGASWLSEIDPAQPPNNVSRAPPEPHPPPWDPTPPR